MKYVDMGLNTAPPKEGKELQEMHERFIASEGAVPQWRLDMDAHAEALKQKVIEAVEAEGSASLNWSCTGETLFDILAHQWAKVLPQYRFEIRRYHCVAYKE